MLSSPVATPVHVRPSSLLRTTTGSPHTVSGTTTTPLESTRPLPWTIVAPVPPCSSPALQTPLIVGRKPAELEVVAAVVRAPAADRRGDEDVGDEVAEVDGVRVAARRLALERAAEDLRPVPERRRRAARARRRVGPVLALVVAVDHRLAAARRVGRERRDEQPVGDRDRRTGTPSDASMTPGSADAPPRAAVVAAAQQRVLRSAGEPARAPRRGPCRSRCP